MSLLIVDTGLANIASVVFAFERLGITPEVSDDPSRIKSAERVILPGVGAAAPAMAKIRSKGLLPVLQSLKQPTLGICLGMQLLFETLEEGHLPSSPKTSGLGLIPGRVGRLDSCGLPAPHMGWNTLEIIQADPILNRIETGDYAYFVHGFAVTVSDVTLAKSAHGSEFSAVVKHNNVYGCQFHPERSAKVGARILENFLKVAA